MADKYVKLDDIIEALEQEWGYEGIREDLQKLPAAEVEEVVRCKDCIMSIPLDKYQRRLYRGTCVVCTYLSTSYHSVIMNKDDFCSYGERKEA